MIRNQDFRGEAADAEQGDVNKHRAADDQPQRVAHGGDVGGDIERIGDQEKPDDAV